MIKYFLIFGILISCSTLIGKNKFESLIIQNKCLEASKNIPLDSNQAKIFKSTKQVVGNITSYTLSISLGIVGVLAALRSGDDRAFGIGSFVHDKLSYIRCYNMDNIALAINDIGSCYFNKDSKNKKYLAIKLLKDMSEDDDFIKCVSSDAIEILHLNLSRMKKGNRK